MKSALICVDPQPDEYDACLRIASFAAAALASRENPGMWDRVALLASPAAALEVLLGAWEATDPLAFEIGERRRTPLVLLPPLVGRLEFSTAEEALVPQESDEPWSGTLADLERLGIVAHGPATGPRSPAAAVMSELGHAPSIILLLGARPEIWSVVRHRPGLIGFGKEAREMRGQLPADAVFLEDAAPVAAQSRAPDREELPPAFGAAVASGNQLGGQIGFLLDRLYGSPS
jgi:hypothetical protein